MNVRDVAQKRAYVVLFALVCASPSNAATDHACRTSQSIVREIRAFHPNRGDLAVAGRVERSRIHRALQGVPGVPFCWGFDRAVAEMARDGPSVAMLAKAHKTPRDYVLTMYAEAARQQSSLLE